MQPAAERRACPPTTQTIATAALRIRQAINSVDDAYIRRRFNFAASLCAKQTPAHVSPGDCGAALHRALDPARAGVDCSSWIDFPVTDFRIPGTTTMTTDGGQDGGEGRPAWVRKTYSANPGAVNVLPRRGGTKGSDEDEWEVLVAAAEVDVERMVEGMEECRGFVGVV
ncbi:putative trichothecene 3-o-acetyltransferase [Diplodia seriata]|uniref:Putative trichothecene 3-o-acetyltransferase n=1 Tax=Diplodia seriata TaxID=420778 RepID=A0A0G2EWT5_9PEZI|nr:putative trichothecene 3-o-acetyltransferase [Diplodia seriata]